MTNQTDGIIENEISAVPPSPNPEVPNNPEIRKTKNGRWKNFLLGFFIVEHIVLLILLTLPIIFFFRTYATTDFLALNEKASDFVPEDTNEVSKKYFEKYEGYLVDFVRPENTNPELSFSIEEKDLNSQLSTLKLDRVEKIYIEADDDNTANIWIKSDVIPYPIIARVKIFYNYEAKQFKVDIMSWAIGPLTFPPNILDFVEESINESAWDSLNKVFEKNYIHIKKIETKKGLLNIEARVDDKVKFTETLLNSSN